MFSIKMKFANRWMQTIVTDDSIFKFILKCGRDFTKLKFENIQYDEDTSLIFANEIICQCDMLMSSLRSYGINGMIHSEVVASLTIMSMLDIGKYIVILSEDSGYYSNSAINSDLSVIGGEIIYNTEQITYYVIKQTDHNILLTKFIDNGIYYISVTDNNVLFSMSDPW